MEYTPESRDYRGRYANKPNDNVWAGVFGIVILAVFVMALNATQSKRLDEVNAHQCAVYGMQPDCKTPLDK